MQTISYLKDSITTGFVDSLYKSNEIYRPQLLVNDKLKAKKVLSSLTKEIGSCDSFFISVAFVTTSGVASIINALDEFRSDGKRGKLLVSDYLYFTQPEALAKLMQFENIELRISRNRKFHAKGYLFHHGSIYNLVIGSSNLTANALSVNTEWNLKVSASVTSELIGNVLKEFIFEFDRATVVTQDFIESYREERKAMTAITNRLHPIEVEPLLLREPNKMQIEALKNIDQLRKEGKDKALLISATGTGKTFLSAFDARAFSAKRLLFIVHRRNIAEAAMRTYAEVFGDKVAVGLYSGDAQDVNADFIFCTVQTISRPEHYSKFPAEHFDYIVVDETHRAGAASYENVLKYFKPQFLLGMTATPERTDGYDVFRLFNYNIAYEIRLQQALEENMLAPFHYYGVTDIEVEGELINENTGFNKLVSSERVRHIIEKARFYGTDKEEVSGLVFCSRNEESRILSEQFNTLGYRTLALSGENSEEQRQKAIERLESSGKADKLDYIFTVDIFNEGVDIPSVNQILLLRPTQSAIIFVQQLGRGLRKADKKSYLTVIDFIGNYSNNYLVPIALYGDTSYSKDKIRGFISAGSTLIPGSSTVDFDRISKERIFDAINNANLQTKRDLIKDYKLLKFRLGRPPLMMDFVKNGSRDPFQYVSHDRIRSYYNFLAEMETSTPELDGRSKLILEHYAKQINNGKRVFDSLVLKQLIENKQISSKAINQFVKDRYGFSLDNKTLQSIRNNLNLEFATQVFGNEIVSIQQANSFKLVKYDGSYFEFGEDMLNLLEQPFAQEVMVDNVLFSIHRFETELAESDYLDGFLLYKKYTRKDVLRVLNWPKEIVAQNIGGSIINDEGSLCALFINYHKEDDISGSTKYEDAFLNNHEFQWMSKSGRKLTSPDIQAIKNNPDLKIYLFVKKSNDEGQEHYFMGDVKPVAGSFEQKSLTRDNGTPASVVRIIFTLQRPVNEIIYDYITDAAKSEAGLIPAAPVFQIKRLDEVVPFEHCLPYYDVTVAAGTFSSEHLLNAETWITIPPEHTVRKSQFVCRVTGDSMNKEIPNGSFCVFEKDEGGSRDGKIVLVASQSIQDADFGAGYTVKRYRSEKQDVEDESRHVRIILSPISSDPSFQDIVLENDELRQLRVIGIFKYYLKIDG